MLVKGEVLLVLCLILVKILTLHVAQNVERPALNVRIIRLARVLFETRALGWALRVLVNRLQRHVRVSDLVAETFDGTLIEADIRTWGQGPGKCWASACDFSWNSYRP